jgi:3beta-hydroxy-delta5-steroid dehydrogenase/steroid delta-isomerase
MKRTQDTLGLGCVLITGGGGFVGQNFVQTMLDNGNKVKSFDIVPCKIQHPNLESIQGNICDYNAVLAACQGVDTIFHTAAIIDLKGGKAVTKEYRDRSYAINVEGTKNVLRAAQEVGAKRFVYTASNSVVIGGKPISGGDETLPYTTRFADLYTETKVTAEKYVLEQDGIKGVRTCSIRPSGIWGPGDQTMFVKYFRQVIKGALKANIGDPKNPAKLDNSYVHNLIHGHVLAAKNLDNNGKACGQAYFINDGDAVNVFLFSRPVIEAIGEKFPTVWVPAWLVKPVMVIWQALHFWFKIPEPPVEPLGIERISIDNYFSHAKAKRDLGYVPLYTTDEAMKDCIPFYIELYKKMKKEAGKA